MIRPMLDAETETPPTEYDLGEPGAAMLASASLSTIKTRRILVEHFAREHGDAALRELFANFIGLANRVAVNARQAVEVFAIVEGGMSDREAERYNMPTVFGAVMGDRLARKGGTDKACGGCAFRRGTMANTSPVTTTDANYCASPGEPTFHCHEGVPEDAEPTKPCAGWANLRAELNRRAE